jgi:hypothetical protein
MLFLHATHLLRLSFAAGKGLKALSRVWHLEQRNSSSSNHNQNHGGSYGERCVESQPSL